MQITALENDVPARFTMAGAEVNDLVRGADDAGFVFDDDDGISQVAQLRDDFDQAPGVAGMEANAGFVEHVECVHQPRAETGG